MLEFCLLFVVAVGFKLFADCYEWLVEAYYECEGLEK